MSPPAHNNVVLGTAPPRSLFWCDFPKKRIPKPAAKPAPKGKHLQLFKMRRKVGKGFWGNVSAPGIFCDPCPTGGLLGGALRGRT